MMKHSNGSTKTEHHIFGAIIGDIAGFPYEKAMLFDRKKAQELRITGKPSMDFDMFATYNKVESKISDDSVFTCAVADVIVRKSATLSREAITDESGLYDALDQSFREWYFLHKKSKAYAFKLYGKNTRMLMENPDHDTRDSNRNGAAMRVSPIAWYFDNLATVREAARISALPTHNSEDGINSAEAVASAIYLARNNSSKAEIKAYIEKEFGYDLNRTLAEIRPEYTLTAKASESIPESIIAFLEGNSFENCIRKAIWLGGDTDTQAAIAGSIAEAFYGIPAELIEKSRAIVSTPSRKEDRIAGRIIEVVDKFYTLLNEP